LVYVGSTPKVENRAVGYNQARALDEYKVLVPEELLQQYEGEYQFTPNFVTAIIKEGDRLFTHSTRQSKSEVFASSKSWFFSKITDVQITFNKNETNNITSLILNQKGNYDT
jgi:hypothetical protein